MLCGCVPVYIGASDVAARIPPDCFIDGDRFDNPADLYAALLAIGEDEFQRRQANAQAFLRGESALAYGDEHFCETLVRTIATDLNLR